jgi:cyclomaltodextrinase / maltogenic alpha-amylase / neopullulanase
MTQIKKGRYKHFKGEEYEVLDVAKHSETLEDYIIYRAMYGEHDLWVRPASMFLDIKEVNGNFVPRFILIEEN